MPHGSARRRELIEAIDGYYAALILDGLHRAGVLRTLRAGGTVASIARRLGLDRRTLSNLLAFLAMRSTVVAAAGRRRGGRPARYALAPSFDLSRAEHLLDQYVGAYGPCLRALPQILTVPRRGERLVDRARHADAFAGGRAPVELVSAIEAFGVRGLLDLGCGGGQVLGTLARSHEDFTGIGVDANVHMVRRARRSMTAEGLSRRVTIRHGDLRGIARLVSRGRRRSIDAVSAASVANGLFGGDAKGIDRLLGSLRRLFPQRLLFLSDYYSRLHERGDADDWTRTLVHDVAQVVSGQGTPPRRLKEWQTIYRRNRVTLLQSIARTDDGVSWFVHVVQL